MSLFYLHASSSPHSRASRQGGKNYNIYLLFSCRSAGPLAALLALLATEKFSFFCIINCRRIKINANYELVCPSPSLTFA